MSLDALLRAIAPLIDAVYPPRCPLCGTLLADQQGLCSACWSQLEFPGDPACVLCSRVLPAGRVHDMQCRSCADQPPLHDGVAAATVYNHTSRQLVLRFKYGGRIALASMLAKLMAGRLADVGPGWEIVPVPLHRWRLWRRGYNQSALLARELARLTGGRLQVDGLVRRRSTPTLSRLARNERAQAVAGAIVPHPRRLLAGARVLLVDDVLTTGATTNACIAALKQAGAVQVRIACFARVMGTGQGAVEQADNGLQEAAEGHML